MSDSAAPHTDLVVLPSSGLLLALAPGDPLCPAMAEGAFDVAELAFAVRACRPGDTVVDAGAHVGLYTVHMARAVGVAGHVHAFEPSAVLARCLRASLAANRQDNVSVTVAALWAGSGPGRLALDQVATRPPVSFIKLDVEGAEWQVLRGAHGLLTRDRPRLLCKIDYPGLRAVSGVTPDDLFGWLGTLGYRACEVAPDGSTGACLAHPPTARTSSVAFVPAE